MKRRRNNAIGVAMLIVAGLAATRGMLWAHAALRSSEPAAGSVLTRSPSRIRLVFSEAVDASVSGIRVVSPVATRDLTVRSDRSDAAVLVATTDSLPAGQYRVVWRTVSVDGHKVSGNFVFTVREDTSKAAPAVLTPPPPLPG